MSRPATILAAVLVALPATLPGPALAQSFFERLFRPPPPPQYIPPQYRPAPPQPQLPRRAPPTTTPGQPQPQGRPAQPGQGAAPPQQQQAAPVPEPPPAPYEKELLRMAEIIGSVAFLRSLCTTPDAGEWPQRMQQLLDAEGTTPGRKERLAGAYNRGYRAFALTYRVCTLSATEATNRYLKEGDQIARGLSGRYGG